MLAQEHQRYMTHLGAPSDGPLTEDQKAYVRSKFEAWLQGRLAQVTIALGESMSRYTEMDSSGEPTKRARLMWSISIRCSPQALGRYWSQLKKGAVGAPVCHQKSPVQLAALESQFDRQPYPDAEEIAVLTETIALNSSQIKAWLCKRRKEQGLTAVRLSPCHLKYQGYANKYNPSGLLIHDGGREGGHLLLTFVFVS
jgi:hypothetical protein